MKLKACKSTMLSIAKIDDYQPYIISRALTLEIGRQWIDLYFECPTRICMSFDIKFRQISNVILFDFRFENVGRQSNLTDVVTSTSLLENTYASQKSFAWHSPMSPQSETSSWTSRKKKVLHLRNITRAGPTCSPMRPSNHDQVPLRYLNTSHKIYDTKL
jgi:hypothetical protein